jgi:hypothetical protein
LEAVYAPARCKGEHDCTGNLLNENSTPIKSVGF